MVMWAVDRFKRYGRQSGRGKLFLVNRLILMIPIQNVYNFVSSMKIAGLTDSGGLWACKIFLDQSICIDEPVTLQLKFFI